jgi:glutamine synthetase
MDMPKEQKKTYFEGEDEILQAVSDQGVKEADLRFIDMNGTIEHVTIRAKDLADALAQGHGFDGSSIPGFQDIHESDMLLVPDASRAYVDQSRKTLTLAINCTVKDPVTGLAYLKDPRTLAARAEQYLKRSGEGDVAYLGPEIEFFIVDDVQFSTGKDHAMHKIRSSEAPERNGSFSDGYATPHKAGYFPLRSDKHTDLRSAMLWALDASGIDADIHHHEVASFGQTEINMRFAPLLRAADNVVQFKYIVQQVALAHGKTVTFMPKPIYKDNGSGMHTHQSIWKDGTNTFHRVDWDGTNHDQRLSEQGRAYAAGLLDHAASILAFAAPSTNSYKRLVPGFEAPVNLVYGSRNRSAAIRIPTYSKSPASTRIEFRPPDPLANPYLAFSAMLLAGLDGIARKLTLGDPVNLDTYHLSEKEKADLKLRTVPGSLEESLQALAQDHEYLLKGGVFTADVISTHIALRKKEADLVHLTPHPREFELYWGR